MLQHQFNQSGQEKTRKILKMSIVAQLLNNNCATTLRFPVGCCCATCMLRNGDKESNFLPNGHNQVITCVIFPPTSI
jgi:hypothetical protein